MILPYLIRPTQDTPITDGLTTCPQCGGKVDGHGTRPRQGIVAGVKQGHKVRRFCCTECGKTFTRLPDFLLPFKRHVAPEIEGVLRHLLDGGKLSEAPSLADERTMRRWWNEFSSKMQQWAGLLESKAYELLNRAPGLLRYSHPLKRLEETLSQLPALPSWWTVMVKTLWWLKTSHPLCLGRPP